jgi:hypothetical protein
MSSKGIAKTSCSTYASRDRAQMGSLLLEFGWGFVCHISVPRRVYGVRRNPL